MKERKKEKEEQQNQQPPSQESSFTTSPSKKSSPIPTHILPLPFSLPFASCGSKSDNNLHLPNHSLYNTNTSNDNDTANSNDATYKNVILSTSSSHSSSLNHDKFTLPALHQRGGVNDSNHHNVNHNRNHNRSTHENRKGNYSNDSVHGGNGGNGGGIVADRFQDDRGRVLCCDRKGFFDHLRTKSLILSTVRVGIVQAAQTLSTYVTDQLEHETQLDEQLDDGEITHLEYETQLLSFEEDEWNKRWKTLFYTGIVNYDTGTSTTKEDEDKSDDPLSSSTTELRLYNNKIISAIGKFHLLTIFMRFYERLLQQWMIGSTRTISTKSNDPQTVDAMVFMDKVTKDTFASAVRKSRRLDEYQYSGGRSQSQSQLQQSSPQRQNVFHISTSGSDSDTSFSSSTSTVLKTSEVKTKLELGIQMFSTCLYANAISFFADLTVQQCILLYGYYSFFISKQRERKLKVLKERYSKYNELKLKKTVDGKEDSYENVKKDENNEKEGLLKNTTSVDAAIASSIASGMEQLSFAIPGLGPPSSSSSNSRSNSQEDDDDDGDEKAIILLSFLRRSVQATITKSFGLVCASLGGAVGSMIYPGWGTLFGTQMGDAAVGALLDG